MVKIPAYIDDIHFLGSHMEHVDIFYIDTFYFLVYRLRLKQQ